LDRREERELDGLAACVLRGRILEVVEQAVRIRLEPHGFQDRLAGRIEWFGRWEEPTRQCSAVSRSSLTGRVSDST
jgi:hypothetical protein